MLESSWTRCWTFIGASGTGRALMRQLLDAYQAPPRTYHTVQHLTECLALYNDYRARAQAPGEVEIALWFHDAVYDVKAADNEERSAAWAMHALQHAGVHPACIGRVKEHILATRHATPPQGQDQALLVDIDLAILGAESERFEEYEAQIRAEYSDVPSPLFRRKRRQILAGFLARSSIYATPELRQRFEERARQNIARAIAWLGG